jgi:hypothetical protein
MIVAQITFPEFTGLRCLMMPYIQGDPDSVPPRYSAYAEILSRVFLIQGDVGYLTIDESLATAGRPHRGDRAKHGRAIHTEAGRRPSGRLAWGSSSDLVSLDPGVQILLASSLGGTCAVWDAVHEDTTEDGDIGHAAGKYPYSTATLLEAGEVRQIGVLTPHESLPVPASVHRQFLRIVGKGVRGREPYFTLNPLVSC